MSTSALLLETPGAMQITFLRLMQNSMQIAEELWIIFFDDTLIKYETRICISLKVISISSLVDP